MAASKSITLSSAFRQCRLAKVSRDFLLKDADEKAKQERVAMAEARKIPWKDSVVFDMEVDDCATNSR